MRRLGLIAGVVAMAAFAACGDDGNTDVLIEPVLDGKSDVTSRVDIKGNMRFGDALAGSFTEDLEFHAYTFAAADGASVVAEITQLGSSRGLDTTLFLYGPNNGSGYGSSALVRDDNDGWGALSKLSAERLEAGSYLLVVGTKDTAGRGDYRIELTCASGECAPKVVVDLATCPADLEYYFEECIADDVFDSQSSPQDAWEYCRDNIDVVDLYETFCNGSADDADFCSVGETVFANEILGVCADQFDAIHVPPTTDLDVIQWPISDEMDDLLLAAYDGCSDYCTVEGFAVKYDTAKFDPTIDEVVNTIIGQLDAPVPYGNDGGERPRADFESELSVLEIRDEMLAEMKTWFSSDTFIVGSASGSAQPWAGVDLYATAWVVVYPDSGIVFVMESSYATE